MSNPTKEANCKVLGDGTGSGDSDHVSMATPFQTKKKEIMNDPQYKIMSGREAATTRARRGGNVRPLDGGVAN